MPFSDHDFQLYEAILRGFHKNHHFFLLSETTLPHINRLDWMDMNTGGEPVFYRLPSYGPGFFERTTGSRSNIYRRHNSHNDNLRLLSGLLFKVLGIGPTADNTTPMHWHGNFRLDHVDGLNGFF